MEQIKPIEPSAVPRALAKAERYRLLNEPGFAESICLDVLAIEPEHQQALVTYLLALTDQFGAPAKDAGARAVLPRLKDPYERSYYAGLVEERLGHACLARGGAGVGETAYDHLAKAIHHYARAHAVHAAGNDDAVLRHNTCVRTMRAHRLAAPPPDPLEYPADM